MTRAPDRWLVAVGASLLLGAGLLAEPSPRAPHPLPVPVVPLPLPRPVRQAVLAAGETAGQLLARAGVPAAEVPEWLESAAAMLNLRSLPIGVVARAVLDLHGNVRAVHLTPDWRADVVLERSPAGIVAHRAVRPVERETVVVQGRIASSLFEAMDATGESDDLAVALAELFSWDIDFHRDLRVDDRFAVLVERVRANGRTVAYGPIVAATFTNKGREFSAIRHTLADAQPSYYDRQGRPMKKQFLRAPLKFTRLTSRFTTSRLHPVLGVRLPHWGVDYAAPVGTPVVATGDGTVSFVGRRGGAGNAVEIRHAGAFQTAYLHLSRFAPGVAVGRRVAQGQVVGFVGSTGLSTGPHLDYRIAKAGHFVNPLSVGGEPAPPLPPAEMPRFVAWASRVMPLLARPGVVPPHQAAAGPPSHGQSAPEAQSHGDRAAGARPPSNG